jgi:uncharacterized membrane protein YqjE
MGLLALIRHIGATIVALLHTRIELLATEFEEELQRRFIIFLWMMLALLFGGLSIIMLAITLLIIFWDDHRVLAAVLITSAFVITAIAMGYLAQARMKYKPRFMAASLEELKRDHAQLERRP